MTTIWYNQPFRILQITYEPSLGIEMAHIAPIKDLPEGFYPNKHKVPYSFLKRKTTND